MMQPLRPWLLAPLSVALGLLIVDDAMAQTPAPEASASASQALVMGDWHVRPLLELRSQAEVRIHPFDTGGASIPAGPSTSTVGSTQPQVDNQWWVLSRGRLGIAAERGPLRAVLELQDARLWGETSALRFDARDGLPTTSARLAFAELRDTGPRASFLRLGRQEIVWGDGRLLGASDWSPTGRSLDAVRGQWVLGNFDFEGFSSILVAPGATPPAMRRGTDGDPEGAGAQLHGVRLAWHIAPLLHVESNNLGRFARQPTDDLLDPSDLYLTGLRIWGSYPGLSYSLEGAYEAGRTAVVGTTRTRSAWAAAAKVLYQPGLFWDLGVGLEGAYATGQKSGDEDKLTRFDPVLPDVRLGLGPMGLYAWSNLVEAAGLVHLSPLENTTLTFSYRYVAMAEPSDAWQTAALTPVGHAPDNDEASLGQELDASIEIKPWAPIGVVAGYGAFLTGDGAKNVLEASGRGRPDLQHHGYLQVTMRVP
jgi:hypothetical protein